MGKDFLSDAERKHIQNRRAYVIRHGLKKRYLGFSGILFTYSDISSGVLSASSIGVAGN